MLKYGLPVIAAFLLVAAVLSVLHSQPSREPTSPPAAPPVAPYLHTVAGVGIVEASSENIALSTPVPGLITQVYVKAGDHVQAGERLFSLDDRDLQAELQLQKSALEVARAQLDKLVHSPRPEEVTVAEAKVAEAAQALADARVQQQLIESVTDRRAIREEDLLRRQIAAKVAIEARRWWRTLNAPILEVLIERAVHANLDLQIAAARVREARALRGLAAADQFPTVTVSSAYARTRPSENITAPGPSRTAGASAPGSTAPESDLFQSGFDATWELDLFGRVHRTVEASSADLAAAEENRRDVLVTLLAELARNYVDLRGFQRRLEIARDNIETQRQTVELTRARFAAGLSSELDVAQARQNLATTESQVPVLESSLIQAIHRLSVLLGQAPGALLVELAQVQPIPIGPESVPMGLPADLLRRRPDIRRAEQELAGATARIGVATADLFPRFSLTGTIDLQSSDIGSLFSVGSRSWAFGPRFIWPIFDAGRIRANIEVQTARQEAALLRYERAVLVALEDVENALIAFAQERLRHRSLAEAVDANRRAVDLSLEVYTRGLGDFLRVLESQRSLFVSEDQLVESERAVVANIIALYKGLGGGWEVWSPAERAEPHAAAEGS